MEEGKSKQGLFGFITILMAIVLIVSVLGIFNVLPEIFSAISTNSVGIEMFLDVVTALLSIASIYLLFLFFKKSKIFPKYFIWFIVARMALMVINAIIAIDQVIILQAIIVIILLYIILPILIMFAWIVSVRRSERVRLTFVN